MELKRMEGSVVYILLETELTELISLYNRNGWEWMGATGFKCYRKYVEARIGYPIRVTIENDYGTYTGNTKKELTLAEFKKEQGIMKYKQGDVLVTPSGGNQFKILAVCGLLYGCSELGDFDTFDGWQTELGLSDCTLKTATPTKTDKTVSEIEKELNLPAGSLNVTAEK